MRRNEKGKIVQDKVFFQGGMHRRLICADCNNALLGGAPDKTLADLYRTTKIALKKNESVVEWKGNIGDLIRAAFGHILASVHYSRSKTAKLMRGYLLKGVVPQDIYLYLFVYPFTEITAYLDCASSSHTFHPLSVITEALGFSGLYFYPLAFLVSYKKLNVVGVELLELAKANAVSLVLQTDSWKNPKTGTPLPSDWPIHVGTELSNELDSAGIVMMGKSGAESITTILQPKGIELAFDPHKRIVKVVDTGEQFFIPKGNK